MVRRGGLWRWIGVLGWGDRGIRGWADAVSGNGWFLGKSGSCIRAIERAREITSRWGKCVLVTHFR